MSQFHGLYTVLVTPFDGENQLDEEGFRENIRYQLRSGVDGLVVLGTTGEAPTLSDAEQEKVIQIAMEEVRGQVPVVVGTGSYSTEHTVKYTLRAQKLGANGVLIVTPYYNKPTQEGLFLHFKEIAESTQIPIIVYNVQGRTGQNLATGTLKRIAGLPNVVGVKEASGNLVQIMDVIEVVCSQYPDFQVISGDDNLTFPLMAVGGHGIFSVASNLLPRELKELVDALRRGDFAKARELHYQYLPLFRAMFVETNPIPVKAAMNMWGMAAGKCRLPLCDLGVESQKVLEQTLAFLRTKDVRTF